MIRFAFVFNDLQFEYNRCSQNGSFQFLDKFKIFISLTVNFAVLLASHRHTHTYQRTTGQTMCL